MLILSVLVSLLVTELSSSQPRQSATERLEGAVVEPPSTSHPGPQHRQDTTNTDSLSDAESPSGKEVEKMLFVWDIINFRFGEQADEGPVPVRSQYNESPGSAGWCPVLSRSWFEAVGGGEGSSYGWLADGGMKAGGDTETEQYRTTYSGRHSSEEL